MGLQRELRDLWFVDYFYEWNQYPVVLADGFIELWTQAKYCVYYDTHTQLTFNCSKSTIKTLEKMGEICLKLTIKTPEQRPGYGVQFPLHCFPMLRKLLVRTRREIGTRFFLRPTPNVVSNIKRNLWEMINLYSPWNNQETILGFLIIPGKIEVS